MAGESSLCRENSKICCPPGQRRKATQIRLREAAKEAGRPLGKTNCQRQLNKSTLNYSPGRPHGIELPFGARFSQWNNSCRILLKYVCTYMHSET